VKIAIIGAGVIGETFIAGFLRSGIQADDVVFCESNEERRGEIEQRYAVAAMSPGEAGSRADVVLIAVKPQDVASALENLGQHLRPGTLVISMAAGIPIDVLQQLAGPNVSVIRVMPNTPAVIGEGVLAMSSSPRCTPEEVRTAQRLLEVAGTVVEVAESQQDAVTAISGSGPAYVFAFMEALEAAAGKLGLGPDFARTLVLQTIAGAALLARGGAEGPAELRRRVTSPGGTTQAALRVLLDEDRGLGPLIAQATTAARDRSIELGRPPQGAGA
jgi:pyrroline-5-carboxylate reductase